MEQQHAKRYWSLITTLLLLCHVFTAGAQQRILKPDSIPLNWWSGNYAYDGSGNIVSIGPGTFGTDVQVYDAFGRLVSTSANTSSHTNTQAITYDRQGNITSIETTSIPTGQSPVIETVAPLVNDFTNRLKDPGTTCTGTTVCLTGSYDEAGNQTANGGGITYSYDALGMLKEVSAAGGGRERYIYDASGERIATVHVTAGAQPAVVSRDVTVRRPDGKVARVFNDLVVGGSHTWKWQEDYVYSGQSLLAAVLPDGTAEKREHFHLDHLGTPRLITDDRGVRLAFHTYLPFGVEAPGSDFDTETMKFTGHERSAPAGVASGLDYMHARFYGTAAGRFLSVDPVIPASSLRFPQRWNRYAYVMNSPVQFSDPSGTDIVLSGCVKDAGSSTCKEQLAAAQAAFGKAWSKVHYENGIITLNKGVTPLSLGKDFGPSARALGFMAGSKDHFTVIADAQQAAQGNGAYTEGLNGGGANIYYDPNKLGGNRTVKMGGVEFGLAETITHETGHAIEPYFANIQAINAKYSAVSNTAHEAFPMFLENAWRRREAGKEVNDIRVYILTPGDVNYPGTKVEDIWP